MRGVQIKKAVRAGNSSAVILPRAWLNKEVRIELIKKTPKEILLDTMGIIEKYADLSSIIGIYLVGSYARKEEDEDSDIDVLVITKEIDREMIHDGIYNVLIVSSELLNQKLERDLLPMGQMIREAKPLLNSNYLDLVKINVTKKNIKWYLDTTQDKIDLIGKIIIKTKKHNKKYIDGIVTYTLILRIRTLEIIMGLIENKDYSKKNFIKKIKRISGGAGAYEAYLAVKNNLKETKQVSLEGTGRLYEYLKKELDDVKKVLKNLE